MKQYALKSFFFLAALLAVACFFQACNKSDPIKTTSHNYGGNGTGNDTTGGANDSTASFNNPTGIAVDAAGNLYIADYGNNLIRKITPAGVVSTLAGSGNQGSVNGAAGTATFNGPTSVTVDPSGNVFVADANNNQIRMIAAADGTVSTIAGSDSTGAQDGLGALAYFFGPGGVAADASGNIFVADAGNNLIRMVTPGGQVSTVAGNTNPGALNGAALSATFNNPSGLAVDSKNNIYVADLLSNMIRKIDNGQVTTLAGSDTTASINGVGTAAGFYFPNSVAVDVTGNLYVTEYVTNLIRKISPNGAVVTFAGNGNAGQADSTGIAASFNGPSGVAVDAAGNVYVADTYNNVIRKITPDGAVTTIAGNGSAGAVNGQALSLRKLRSPNAVRKPLPSTKRFAVQDYDKKTSHALLHAGEPMMPVHADR